MTIARSLLIDPTITRCYHCNQLVHEVPERAAVSPCESAGKGPGCFLRGTL